MSRLERQMGTVTGALNLVKNALIAYGAVRIGQSITNTAIAFQRMETTLRFATGSMQGATQEIQFLRKESERLGQDFLTAGRAYSKLAAAGSALGLSTTEIRKTFTGVSAAATVMGLSAFEAEGAFNALQQMLAKGKVQAEELRGQLGERIPTAIADGAAAMGMSVQQLSKALDNGEVDARKFVTRLSAYWVEKFGNQIPKASENANIAITDFGNAVQEVQLAVARSGFLSGLTVGLEKVAGLLTDPGVIQGAQTFGRAIGDAFVFIAENAETVLRVFAAIGGALKGAAAGGAFGPQGALVGALVSGAAGAGSPEIFELIMGGAEEAGRSVDDLRAEIQSLEMELTEAAATQEAFGDAAIGVSSDILRIQVALARTREELAQMESAIGDGEFMDAIVGNGGGGIGGGSGPAAATIEYTKAQDTALGKLQQQAALLNVVGIAQRKVTALIDTGSASLGDAIKIAQGHITSLTKRQQLVLQLVAAIEKEEAARARRIALMEAEQEEQDALADADAAAIQASEDQRVALTTLMAETKRSVEENEKLAEAYGQSTREGDIYARTLDLMRQNQLLSASAAREMATELVESEEKLRAIQQANADLEGFFDQTFNRIGEAITQAFATGEISAINFGDIAKGVLSEVTQFALKLAVINPLKNMLAGGSALPTLGTLFGGAGGAAGAGAGGAGGIFGSIANIGSSAFSAFSGGTSSLASSFALSGFGQTIGLSSAPVFGLGASAAGGVGAGAATAGAAGSLTAAGSALVAAAPYIAIAAAAIPLLMGTGLFGGSPSSGPVSIAHFAPFHDIDPIDYHDRPFSGNNGVSDAQAEQAMRGITEAIIDILQQTAERFDAIVDNTLTFRVANYQSPEGGNADDRIAGYEVNAFIQDSAEQRIAEGLSEEQAIFEALKFAVQEAFTFDNAALTEAAMNTAATTTDELLADLEFAKELSDLRIAIRDLGDVIDSNTLATARLQMQLENQADEFAQAAVEPIAEAIAKALELFPAIEGTERVNADGTPANDNSGYTGSPLSVDTAGRVLVPEENGIGGGTFDYGFQFETEENDLTRVGFFNAGDQRFDVERVNSDTNREGMAFAVSNEAGEVVATFDTLAEALAGAGDALSEYSTALEDTETTLVRTAEEQARYDANLARVGFQIDVAKQSVQDLVDQVTGDFEPAFRGPFKEALEVGQANLDALEEHLVAVNDEIQAANEAFPELNQSLIDVTQTIADANAALLENLQNDFNDSIQQQINNATGLGSINSINALVDARDENLSEAEAIGGNTDLVNQLFETQLRNIIESLDAATQASLQSSTQITDQFANDLINQILGGLGDAAANITLESQANAILENLAIQDQIDAQLRLIDARRSEANAARSAADLARRNSDSLTSAANSLLLDATLSPLFVQDRRDEALRQFDAALALANDGTPDDEESQRAIQELPGLGRSALEAALAWYGSSTEYNAIAERVQQGLLTTAANQKTIEEQQLDVLRQIEQELAEMGVAANDNSQPTFMALSDGQYVSTGANGVPAGLDLGRRPEDNLRIYQILTAAGIGYTGAGEGQIGALRRENDLANTLLTAAGFADGGVFARGNVIPFARGGVVSRPTLFPIGLMGEAGAEAIMPLSRGADGRLGVTSAGGGGFDPQLIQALIRRFDVLIDLMEEVVGNTGQAVRQGRNVRREEAGSRDAA